MQENLWHHYEKINFYPFSRNLFASPLRKVSTGHIFIYEKTYKVAMCSTGIWSCVPSLKKEILCLQISVQVFAFVSGSRIRSVIIHIIFQTYLIFRLRFYKYSLWLISARLKLLLWYRFENYKNYFGKFLVKWQARFSFSVNWQLIVQFCSFFFYK